MGPRSPAESRWRGRRGRRFRFRTGSSSSSGRCARRTRLPGCSGGGIARRRSNRAVGSSSSGSISSRGGGPSTGGSRRRAPPQLAAAAAPRRSAGGGLLRQFLPSGGERPPRRPDGAGRRRAEPGSARRRSDPRKAPGGRMGPVLADLQYRVGTERLLRGVEDFVRGGPEPGTARELLAAIERRSGVSLQRMYDDYFVGKAIPVLTLDEVSFRADGRRWVVEGVLRNKGTGESFCPVVLRTAAGPVRQTLRVDSKESVPFHSRSSTSRGRCRSIPNESRIGSRRSARSARSITEGFDESPGRRSWQSSAAVRLRSSISLLTERRLPLFAILDALFLSLDFSSRSAASRMRRSSTFRWSCCRCC